MAFLQENEQRITELLADLHDHVGTDPIEPGSEAAERLQKWAALLREYSEEIATSGMPRREMRKRVLALIDDQFERPGNVLSLERFELLGLLRVFAAEAISSRGDTTKRMQGFMNEWDVHHRGIRVKVIAFSAWMLACDDVLGAG